MGQEGVVFPHGFWSIGWSQAIPGVWQMIFGSMPPIPTSKSTCETGSCYWSWFVMPGWWLELNHTHDAGIKHPRMAFLLWCLHMVTWFVRKAAGPTLWRHHQFMSGSLRITNHTTKKITTFIHCKQKIHGIDGMKRKQLCVQVILW